MYLFTSQPRHQKLDLPWFVGSVAAPHYKISILAENMELVKDFVNNQLTLYLLPVVLVIVVVILVFTFGFKSAEQPPFDKLTNDDRKQAGKKKKIKEKVGTVTDVRTLSGLYFLIQIVAVCNGNHFLSNICCGPKWSRFMSFSSRILLKF